MLLFCNLLLLFLIIFLKIVQKLNQAIKIYVYCYWMKTLNLSSVLFNHLNHFCCDNKYISFVTSFNIMKKNIPLRIPYYPNYMDTFMKCLAPNEIVLNSFWKENFSISVKNICLAKDSCELWTLKPQFVLHQLIFPTEKDKLHRRTCYWLWQEEKKMVPILWTINIKWHFSSAERKAFLLRHEIRINKFNKISHSSHAIFKFKKNTPWTQWNDKYVRL